LPIGQQKWWIDGICGDAKMRGGIMQFGAALQTTRKERWNTMKGINQLRLVLATVTVLTSLPAGAQVTAPAWNLPSIYGTNIHSTSFAGKVVVLNFFATWCGPCCAEIPSLIALQQKYAPDGMTVVGISIDASTNGINPPTSLLSSFAASYGINYPVVMDAPGDVAENLYGPIAYPAVGYLEYIPTTFVMDRQNHIVQTFIGEQTYSTYESAVLPLIYANLTVNVCMSNSLAHISWPLTRASFVVQSCSNLCGGAWTQETETIQSNSACQFINVSLGPKAKFFRLETP